MQRKSSRRPTNYFKQMDQSSDESETSEQNEQENFKPQRSTNESEGHSNHTDTLIADMAQGFIKAQAKINDQAVNTNNMEIALLLQKINDQLTELNQSAPPNENQGGASQKSNNSSTQEKTTEMPTQSNNTQKKDGDITQKVELLLKNILQGKTSSDSDEEKSSNASTNTNSNTAKKQQNTLNVQTVSQVLAQAQYELANELETSLKKLKQVISESEKLANNISNLLGDEAKNKS